MKNTRVNISLYELTKTTGQQDILLNALGKTSIDSNTSSNKGSTKSPDSLAYVINTLHMEEENSFFPPFLFSFEIFNFNVHNYLVDFGYHYPLLRKSMLKEATQLLISST